MLEIEKESQRAQRIRRLHRVCTALPHPLQPSARPKTAPQTGILLRHFRKRGVVHTGARRRTLYPADKQRRQRLSLPHKTPSTPR